MKTRGEGKKATIRSGIRRTTRSSGGATIMPGERLKNEEEERELRADAGGREDEKIMRRRRNRRATLPLSARFASPREKHRQKIIPLPLSQAEGVAGWRRVRRRPAGLGEGWRARRFASRSGAMPPLPSSSPSPLPSTTTFGTDNGANTPRG